MIAPKIYPEIGDGEAAQTVDWLRDSYTDLPGFLQRVAQPDEAVLLNLKEEAGRRPRQAAARLRPTKASEQRLPPAPDSESKRKREARRAAPPVPVVQPTPLCHVPTRKYEYADLRRGRSALR